MLKSYCMLKSANKSEQKAQIKCYQSGAVPSAAYKPKNAHAFNLTNMPTPAAQHFKCPLQELVVDEPEGNLPSDDTTQQVLLHILLHFGTEHEAGQRVLLHALALTRAPLVALILVQKLHLIIHSRRALAGFVVLLGGLVGLREVDELGASLAPQHAWLQLHLLSNDDVVAP